MHCEIAINREAETEDADWFVARDTLYVVSVIPIQVLHNAYIHISQSFSLLKPLIRQMRPSGAAVFVFSVVWAPSLTVIIFILHPRYEPVEPHVWCIDRRLSRE